MQAANNAEPAFPPEIEHEIFETAAILYPKIIPTLLRVSRRVLGWIEPLLYASLRISAAETKGAYDDAVLHALDQKPPDFFPKTTRQVFFSTMGSNFFATRTPNPWTNTELERLLRMCTGVDDLFLFGDLLHPSLRTLFEEMRPTHLTIFGNMFHATNIFDFGHPFFNRVSHLQLLDIDDGLSPTWAPWSSLSRITTLTHLVVFRSDLVPVVLANLPTLKVLVLYSDDPHFPRDPRLVIASTDEVPNDLFGSGRLWVRVDAFIARKQSGELEESCYDLPAQ
ncbi:hypothetical protein B0H11DRAFT_1345563 [Mycena galericulata]|nr:hypothetical protein B0H11DRAFT_1345563 [Mycena galericulata]